VSYKYLISQSNILNSVHVYRPHVMLLLNLRVVLSIEYSCEYWLSLSFERIAGDW